jgi:hypothetical protein
MMVNINLIEKINFLQTAHPSLVHELSQYFRPALVMADSYVMEIGEVAHHMYFIKSGIIEV